jgi:DNA ligase-1
MKAALLTHDIPEDVTGWLASVKMDGIRAIWDGETLRTRNGKDLNPPVWFTSGLPDRRLDGELWMGNGTFDRLVSILQKPNGDWMGIKFMIFDLAESGTVESRIMALESIELPPHAERVIHIPIIGHLDLDDMERIVVAGGGEGCVIRRPGSPYRPGRMGDTIKVKRLVADEQRWKG